VRLDLLDAHEQHGIVVHDERGPRSPALVAAEVAGLRRERASR